MMEDLGCQDYKDYGWTMDVVHGRNDVIKVVVRRLGMRRRARDCCRRLPDGSWDMEGRSGREKKHRCERD